MLIYLCLLTGYVLNDFGRGKITPIVTDKFGDVRKVTNYRPFTIVCILSKVFESCTLEYVEQLISKNYLQFGCV